MLSVVPTVLTRGELPGWGTAGARETANFYSFSFLFSFSLILLYKFTVHLSPSLSKPLGDKQLPEYSAPLFHYARAVPYPALPGRFRIRILRPFCLTFRDVIPILSNAFPICSTV